MINNFDDSLPSLLPGKIVNKSHIELDCISVEQSLRDLTGSRRAYFVLFCLDTLLCCLLLYKWLVVSANICQLFSSASTTDISHHYAGRNH